MHRRALDHESFLMSADRWIDEKPSLVRLLEITGYSPYVAPNLTIKKTSDELTPNDGAGACLLKDYNELQPPVTNAASPNIENVAESWPLPVGPVVIASDLDKGKGREARSTSPPARGKKFISIVDAAKFFYQWRVHPVDTHLQAVVSHRGQEQINVAIMGSVNSVAYVQRQIDNILRDFRPRCRAYIDDITIVADTPEKCYLFFPSLLIFGKEIDSVGMTTDQEKLKAIASLKFPTTYKQLETYLGRLGNPNGLESS
ncbi:hypothetical protein N7488_011934 [Penicillium malachiteum]|nr:hypothetical protein N7488_011934 [Penicillium malachiteum]